MWAESYAKTFLEKMKEQINKKYYVVFVDGIKMHILTLSTKKIEPQVIEELVLNIEDLQNISLQNVWSQNNPIAKVLSFTTPSGEFIKCSIPYTSKKYSHERQTDHLDDLVALLMPTE